MLRVLIIGFGNPLRCDDGLAWRVAEELSYQQLPDDVEVITQHQLTPELAFAVSRAETVLFVDAAQGGEAGEASCVPVNLGQDARSLTHDLSPAGVLNLARVLYGALPRGFVLSLMGECFEHGEALSPKVEESLPRLLQLVTAFFHAGRRVVNLIPSPKTVHF
jgi:hydrogenase maturation protease